MSDIKVWVVEFEKTVTINVAIPKEEANTKEMAIDLAFDSLSYDDKKNYEFKSIWEETQ
jgi:hypothetical protein